MNTTADAVTWPPHIVVACVVEHQGKFLLVYEQESDPHGNIRLVYNQPAGHWDEGETLLAAAIRETQEESGWNVELSHIIGQYVYQSPINHVTYYRIAFAAQPLQRITEVLDEEIIEAVWLSYDEIMERKDQLRSPLVLRVIDDYLSGHCYPLHLISHVE